MMSKFLIVILLFLPAVVIAAPPTAVDLSLDMKKNLIHVHAEHTSERLDKHYLRKMTVSVNGVEQNTVYYHRQASPVGLDADIPMKFKPNDRIHVELFCSKGGSASGDITIPVPVIQDGAK